MARVLRFAVIAFALAGCSQAPSSTPFADAPNAKREAVAAPSSGYRVIHNFGGWSDGRYPSAGVIVVGGTVYGTTGTGGVGTLGGTAFRLATSGGDYRLLHSFGGAGDGLSPQSMMLVRGSFYGTTASGGARSGGTFFAIDGASGRERVLHSFGAKGDGRQPNSPIARLGNVFYGTTHYGGTTMSAAGAAFAIDRTGNERVLHTFLKREGLNPSTGLIAVGQTLYGAATDSGPNGLGSVFALTPQGQESLVTGFSGSIFNPCCSLVAIGGTLYGIVNQGIFSVTPGGSATVLYGFTAANDGSAPNSLIVVGGVMYGVTSGGGIYNGGTLFSLTTSGQETILHNFGHGFDGSMPSGPLFGYNGTLYGTTTRGGALAGGTIFAFKLP